jgi:putative flippase GtrA
MVMKSISDIWRQQQEIRFLAIGAWNTAFGYGIFVFLYYLTGNEENYIWLALAAHFIAVVNAFICHKHLVFNSRQHWLPEFIRFNLSYVFSLSIGIALLFCGVRLLRLHPIVAQGLSIFFSTILSYLLHRNFSFRTFASRQYDIKNKLLPAWTGRISSFQADNIALLSSVIFAGTIFPRLMLLGYYPRTDEGAYGFLAQMIHHGIASGNGIPDYGPLAFYPMLCSWVFALDYNPMISLRLIDLGAAMLMAFVFYRVLARTCGSKTGAALLVLAFTFTMNDTVFIDSGFKNSIMAALVPLFLALHLGQCAVQDKKHAVGAWWAAGALTALAIIIRETFVPFAVLGLVSAFVACGRQAALRFLLGGVMAGAALIGGILIARGGMTEAVSAYRAAGIVFDAVPSYTHQDHFIFYGLMAIRLSAFVLLLSMAAGIVLLIAAWRRRDRSLVLGVLFWCSFIGVSLIETVFKLCFPYHFAVALPGFAGLCALALREIIRAQPAVARVKWLNEERRNFMMVGSIVSLAIWFFLLCASLAKFYWPITLETLAAAPGGNWPEKFAEHSNYLLAAREIKKIIPENGSLSVSGNMHALYPLTGHLPPSRLLDNLSATTILLNLSIPAIRQSLLDCAPDVIMTTTRNDWATGGGSTQLFRAVLDTGIYETAGKIPVSRTRHYGNYGGVIFRKTRETACRTK